LIYVVSESILAVWLAGLGDTYFDPPCTAREIRDHSVQFLDVFVESPETVDTAAKKSKTSC